MSSSISTRRHSGGGLFVSFIAILSMLATGSAMAQLEEIVVTATKRETSLQDTPVAVSAFTGAQLDRAGVTDTIGLSNLVPNVTIGTEGARDAVYIAIRGISQNERRNTDDATTPMYIDGATVPRMSGVNAYFYDVDRVEVLRGPQGTLYGRNSTSGVVNVITNKPNFDDVGGDIEATLGNYNWAQFKGALNIPLSDSVAARFAFIRNTRDGYRDNGPLVEDGDDADDVGVRGHLLWNIGDTTSLLFSADYYNRGGVGAVAAELDCSALGCPASASYAPDPAKANPLNTQGSRDNTDKNFKLELNHSFEAFDLNFLASWRDHERNYVNDNDGSGSTRTVGGRTLQNMAVIREPTKSESVTSELRLTSTGDGPLNWILGGYYLNEKINGAFNLFRPISAGPQGTFLLRFPDVDLTIDSRAVFGNVTYDFNDDWTLNVGLRYTDDEKDKGGNPDNPGAGSHQIVQRPLEAGVIGFPWPRAQVANPSFSDTTWSVGLNWNVNEESFAYAKVSTGYKAGGFNRGSNTGSSAPNIGNLLIYQPETVTAYEVGYKTDIMDGRGRINAAFFYNDYKDKVESVVTLVGGVPTNTAVNAADAEILGFELESSFLYGESGGRVDFNLGYLDATYGTFDNLPDPFTGGSLDVSGGTLANAPKWNLYLTWVPVEWEAMNGTMTPRLQVSYKSDYTMRPHNTLIDQQESYTRTNASLFWESHDSGLYGEAFVQNIEDEDILTNVGCSSIYSGPGGNYCNAIFQPPRTYGVRLGYRF